jgi:hypothetical protein
VTISDLTRATFEEVVATCVDSRLRALAFRHRGKVWRWIRSEADPRLLNIIEVQRYTHAFSGDDNISFTLNWATFVRGYSEAARAIYLARHPDSPLSERPPPKRTSVRVTTAPFYGRIGALSHGHDIWWNVIQSDVFAEGATQGAVAVEAGARQLLCDKVEALLAVADRRWTPSALLQFIESSDSPQLHWSFLPRPQVAEVVRDLLS